MGSFLRNHGLKQNTGFGIIKSVIEMVYVCDNCGFLFNRAGEQDRCPDCGMREIRPANPVEQDEFTARVAELIRDEYSGRQYFPNYVETEISMLNTFTFKLPATALQIDSGMVVEILVEYGESAADSSELLANVWAKEDNGVTVRFLMSVRLPMKRNEPPKEQVNRIFAALNENETFKTTLYHFIAHQLEHSGS